MPGDDVELGAGEREHLGDELSEPTGADEQHAVGRCDVDLLQDLDRGSERLGEHRGVVAHAVGHAVQVREREAQELGVRAVAVDDAEHGSRLAVGRASGSAGGAGAARVVDLADDARAEPVGVRSLHDLADELVAEDSGVGVVAALQLEVGAADARQRDAHKRFTGGAASGMGTSRTDSVLSSSHSAFTGLLTKSVDRRGARIVTVVTIRHRTMLGAASPFKDKTAARSANVGQRCGRARQSGGRPSTIHAKVNHRSCR